MGPWQVEGSRCSSFVAMVTRLVEGSCPSFEPHGYDTCDVIVVAVVGGEIQLRKRRHLK